MIVTTPYPDLVRFLHPELVSVESIPAFDGFIIQKELNYNEVKELEHLTNFIAISDAHARLEWGREEIIALVIKKIKSRRKPKFEWMSDEEFVGATKTLYVRGVWPSEEENEVTVFDLFQNLLSAKAVEIYFRILSSGTRPEEVMLSLLTFCKRSLEENYSGIHRSYVQVLKSSRRVVGANFKRALTTYAKGGSIPSESRVLRFVLDLGDRNAYHR